MRLLAAILAVIPSAAVMTAASAAEPSALTVRINEVESNGGSPGDWVELVNTGGAPVDVSGWVVKDNDDTHSYVVASGMTMAPGAFLALDVDPAFGLGAADTARLFEADGTSIVDSYAWTAHAATTYGRCPDGSGEFVTTTSSTKGAANDCAAPNASVVKINEVESDGGSPADWIELVNTGSAAVDVSGWVLKDNDDTHSYVVAAGTTLAPHGFLALDVDPSFGLGGADSARLFLSDATTLVDSYSWPSHAATTYGRCPDGSGAFVTTKTATKGAANDCEAAATAPMRINEIESNGGTPGDWVELVNIGSAPVDVSGWVVKDNDDTHSYVVAAGTSVAPGAFLVLDVDPSFGLGAADSARLFADDGATLVDTYSWTAHAATTYGRCPDGTGTFTTTTTSTRGAANDCSSPVRVNEIESDGGTPGDWVELVNTGANPVDVSGWVVKDSDDSHSYTIAAGTTMAAGAFLALDVDPSFGLGGADSVRLFETGGAKLVDSYSWTAHAAVTYGRCPDGTGTFTGTTAPTKGAANACPGQVTASPWPGGAATSTVDGANVLGGNMSGLAYQASGSAAPGVLWAVKNGPGTLYRMRLDGTTWTPDTADGFGAGKTLRYPTGTGDPDAEGVTFTSAGPAGGLFVATERDNSNSGVSRPAIVRFDPTAVGTTLNATTEWVLTGDLPAVGANLGLEAISWISDSVLTSQGFYDEHSGEPYNPAAYPNHGSGLFFVGVEANGTIYAYALDQAGGTFTRVATIASGFPGVMDLQYEAETDKLWAVCDDTCTGRSATLEIDGAGRFVVGDVYERPGTMPNYNNEGFAITPQTECVDGHKPVFWSDDSNDEGHALRGGTVNCTVLDPDSDNDGINDDIDVTFPPGTSQAANPANDNFSDALIGGSTSGRVLTRNGNTLALVDAGAPTGVRIAISGGTGAAKLQLTGSAATLALGSGTYDLSNAGRTSTVATIAGAPAVVTVTVNTIPVTLTVGPGESVTYTEVTAANGSVTRLTDITHIGLVNVRASGMPELACGAIAIREVIISTSGNAQITGTPGDDLIVAKVGNVTVNGNGGSDCIVTSSGNDRITTADGDDWIDAGGGNNVLNIGGGNNTILAASGNDQVTTGAGNDNISVGGGNNTINAGGGTNLVTTESGNDTISAGDGGDIINAGNGNNTIVTGDGIDSVKTGSGNDSVDCGSGSDSAQIGGGNNTNVANRCETFTK